MARLQSVGLQRVRHDGATEHTHIHLGAWHTAPAHWTFLTSDREAAPRWRRGVSGKGRVRRMWCRWDFSVKGAVGTGQGRETGGRIMTQSDLSRRCLSLFRQLWQGTRDWVAYTQQKLHHSSGGLKLKARMPARSDSDRSPPPGCKWPTFCRIFTWWKGQKSSQESF